VVMHCVFLGVHFSLTVTELSPSSKKLTQCFVLRGDCHNFLFPLTLYSTLTLAIPWTGMCGLKAQPPIQDRLEGIPSKVRCSERKNGGWGVLVGPHLALWD
jgi:hypothetical protein